MSTYSSDSTASSVSDLAFDPASIRKYSFPTDSVPRLSADDPETLERMKASLPVIITDSNIVSSALKWNLGYLQENLGNGYYYVYTSKNNKFKYYDHRRAHDSKPYPIPIKRLEVTFPQFIALLKQRQNAKEKVYLQQTLNETAGKRVVADYIHFNWDLIQGYQNKLGWGSLTSNLLLIGLENNITPLHYDEQENLFTQLQGYKRFLLFSPNQFEYLYPHPVAHPCDRQSQVDFENPDFERFPKFRYARGLEAIVGPGDVLYIPMYWWHQVESLTSLVPSDNGLSSVDESDNENYPNDEVPPVTISLNFWYRGAPLPDHLEHPLTGQQRVSVMRNVEKLLASALGSADEVGKLLRTMVEGRYDVDV